ncbi:L,D-transpeptidase [Spirillospora albida]|uniref:L,D-transpeptidase n=1 Tax=Spirillospora albida TaxID=58123 RepID=UPI00068F7EBC|nr:L,D-transpeptidase [Spirillospora albida]
MDEHTAVRAVIMSTLAAALALAGTTRTDTGGARQPVSVDQEDVTLASAAERRLALRMAPLENELVGVGMPVQVFFSAPITGVSAKRKVERRLTVRMSERVWGAWRWINDREVDFRPREPWPAGQRVRVVADLKGIRLGNGLLGAHDRVLNFRVGDRHITHVDGETLHATVYEDGDAIREMRVSLGKPGYETWSGTMIAQEKRAKMIMDSDTVGEPGEYRVRTHWNVRLTYSGTFIHSAPWSVYDQGDRNVSHGCINVSPEDAEWFYDFTRRGDIVLVTGTERRLEFGNGPTPWAIGWEEWKEGSALGRAIKGRPLR